MSSLTAAGKLKKSRLDDATRCSGFSSAAKRCRTGELSQFWDNLAGVLRAGAVMPTNQGSYPGAGTVCRSPKPSGESCTWKEPLGFHRAAPMVAGARNQQYLQLWCGAA